MDEKLFIGTWKLTAFQAAYENGKIEFPCGQQPVGLITYLSDKRMFAIGMKNDRALIDFEHLDQNPSEVIRENYFSFFSYAGTYDICENKVIHHVEVSHFPNCCGRDLIRYFEFKDDDQRLILIGEKEKQKESSVIYMLAWEKMSEEGD